MASSDGNGDSAEKGVVNGIFQVWCLPGGGIVRMTCLMQAARQVVASIVL